MRKEDQNIVLIGMRGSGKTTIGAALAGRLHKEFMPLDALIVYEAGMTIPEIVDTYGWEHFRKIESKVVEKTAKIKGIINATGGGVILNSDNVAMLRKSGIVIWLRVAVDNILSRIGEDPNRPSLTGKSSRRDDMLATLQEREKLYEQAAHHIIDTDGKTQDKIAEEIARWLETK